MSSKTTVLRLLFFAGLMVLLLALISSNDRSSGSAKPSRLLASAQQKNESHLKTAYAQLPLSFELNKGQTDPEVKFLSRGNGRTLFLTPSEAVLVLQPPRPEGVQRRGVFKTQRDSLRPEKTSHPAVVRMRFVRANSNPKLTAFDPQPGRSNYFIGSDPKKWRTNVLHYGRVKYEGLYPGVDLVLYGNNRQLEYDLVLAPGVDPGKVELSFEGAKRLHVKKNGDLVLDTGYGRIVQQLPVVYQEMKGGRKKLEGAYVLRANSHVGFRVAAHDRSKFLIIDPTLVYSTYLGGAHVDYANSIAVDDYGNAYVIGTTTSTDFPTAAALQAVHAGGRSMFDAFVSKLNASGSELVYSTYLGGKGDDNGGGIAVDDSGYAYVSGVTDSTDFPTTVGAIQTTNAGYGDAFVSKLDASGSALVYSTYLGGSSNDGAGLIAVDRSRSVYVAGGTSSKDFPTTAGVLQAHLNGDGTMADAFVSKLDASGSALVYSTYLGGSGSDWADAITVDSFGKAYVTGTTFSTDFPTTVGAIQTAYAGNGDGFVSKLNASGSALIYSTYLGGADADYAYGIAVGDFGNAYVAGVTQSTDFPTVAPLQGTHGGGIEDAFVSKLNVKGSALIYSTYLGGTDWDDAFAIAVDNSGNAYVTGQTASTDFPTTRNALQLTNAGGADVFISKISVSGSALLYSTYLGGEEGDDWGGGIALDCARNVYVAGSGASDFPTSTGAFQVTNAGLEDAFALKLGGKGRGFQHCPTREMHRHHFGP
jgi:hypothetical protein